MDQHDKETSFTDRLASRRTFLKASAAAAATSILPSVASAEDGKEATLDNYPPAFQNKLAPQNIKDIKFAQYQQSVKQHLAKARNSMLNKGGGAYPIREELAIRNPAAGYEEDYARIIMPAGAPVSGSGVDILPVITLQTTKEVSRGVFKNAVERGAHKVQGFYHKEGLNVIITMNKDGVGGGVSVYPGSMDGCSFATKKVGEAASEWQEFEAGGAPGALMADAKKGDKVFIHIPYEILEKAVLQLDRQPAKQP